MRSFRESSRIYPRCRSSLAPTFTVKCNELTIFNFRKLLHGHKLHTTSRIYLFTAVLSEQVWGFICICTIHKFHTTSSSCIACMRSATRFRTTCILSTMILRTIRTRIHPVGFEPQCSRLGITTNTTMTECGLVFRPKNNFYPFHSRFVTPQFRKSRTIKCAF